MKRSRSNFDSSNASSENFKARKLELFAGCVFMLVDGFRDFGAVQASRDLAQNLFFTERFDSAAFSASRFLPAAARFATS